MHTNEFYVEDKVMSHTQAAEYLRRKQKVERGQSEEQGNGPKGILKKPSSADVVNSALLSTTVEPSIPSEISMADTLKNAVSIGGHEDVDDSTIYEICEMEDEHHRVVSHEVRDIKSQFEAIRQVIDSAGSNENEDGDRDKLRKLLDLLQHHEDSSGNNVSGTTDSNVSDTVPRPKIF